MTRGEDFGYDGNIGMVFFLSYRKVLSKAKQPLLLTATAAAAATEADCFSLVASSNIFYSNNCLG